MKVRIPATSSDIVASLGLESFLANHRKFNRRPYFEWLDECIRRLKFVSQDGEVDPKNLARSLVGMLDEEGVLLSRALEKKSVEFDTDEKWAAICIAAGWVLVKMHAKAVEEGKWPE